MVENITLKNTHNANNNDRGTDRFRISISNKTEGPWNDVLTESLPNVIGQVKQNPARLGSGCPIILAFTFTFGILSGQIGFVSLAPVTKYVLIVCYDNQIGNSLIEINTKIVFKFRSIITKFADPFCHSSTLLLIGRQRSRDLFFNPFLAFYWHIFMYLVFLTLGI